MIPRSGNGHIRNENLDRRSVGKFQTAVIIGTAAVFSAGGSSIISPFVPHPSTIVCNIYGGNVFYFLKNAAASIAVNLCTPRCIHRCGIIFRLHFRIRMPESGFLQHKRDRYAVFELICDLCDRRLRTGTLLCEFKGIFADRRRSNLLICVIIGHRRKFTRRCVSARANARCRPCFSDKRLITFLNRPRIAVPCCGAGWIRQTVLAL